MTDLSTTTNYRAFLTDLKERVRRAQLSASLSVNRELILLYWGIGRDILARQASQGWGSKVVKQLSHDLRVAFPEMKGFSERNLLFMRRLAETYPDEAIVKRRVSLLPWGHNIRLMQKVKDPDQRLWYLQQSLEKGWSRDMLVLWIDSDLHARQGAAVTNFERTLPTAQSDLASQTLKDPYKFDFLTLDPDAHERALERGLVQHIRDFLVELCVGFAFMGTQVHIAVSDQDFYMDMLFYHVELRAFVVVELKAHAFKPEYAGKLSFYLSAVDELMRKPGDQPTIGLLLCKTKDELLVEYALSGVNKPIGVANWEAQIVRSLPEDLEGSLPTVAQLEAELMDGEV